jgi:hypothetical protein
VSSRGRKFSCRDRVDVSYCAAVSSVRSIYDPWDGVSRVAVHMRVI